MKLWTLRWIGCLCLALEVLSGNAGAEVLQDDWAKVRMGDAQIGFFHVKTEKVVEEGREIFVTHEETSFAMKRAGIVLKVGEKAETREDENGRVLNFKMERTMAGDALQVIGEVVGEEIKMVANAMNSTVPYPKGALGPRKIDREIRRKGFAPGTETSLPMFNRENPGDMITIKTVMLKPEKMEIGGQDREWLVSESTLSHMPGMTIKSWADEKGDFQLIRMPMGGLGTIEMHRSSREEALQEAQPAEMFTNTLIVPSRPIPSPERLKEARYRITAPRAESATFLSGEGQSTSAKGDGVFEVTVRLPEPPPSESVFRDAPIPDAAYAAYLKPSPFIQSDDPAVVALARQIAGNESNALTLAARIQRGVYMKMSKKNLATGIASASAVAQSLEGDCTEHSVLAAALARALGLPSRIVVGMVYAPAGADPAYAGRFGYHMWAEVLVAPGVWWPVDAAFGRYDVTHLAMVKSPMDKAGFEAELVVPLLQVMGDLKLEVLGTKQAGAID